MRKLADLAEHFVDATTSFDRMREINPDAAEPIDETSDAGSDDDEG
jgi:hypothetical protein